MRGLYFDTATCTGWACGDLRAQPVFGHFHIINKHAVAPFLIEAEGHMERLILKHEPDVMGYEAPLLHGRDNPDRLRRLYGLVNILDILSVRYEIPCHAYSMGQVRVHFLGRNYPKDTKRVKIALNNKCRKLGFRVQTDDESDALAGLDYMLSLQKPDKALDTTPLFQSKASRKRGEEMS